MTSANQPSPRQQRQLDQALTRSLTAACETAKAEIVGFTWVTHEVVWSDFSASLRLIWVFETEADISRAVSQGDDQRLLALSAAALDDAGITVPSINAIVSFDSEQACQHSDQGDWRARLDRLRRRLH